MPQTPIGQLFQGLPRERYWKDPESRILWRLRIKPRKPGPAERSLSTARKS
jgi:hypothetical protein